jgi:peptide deformylase
MMLKIIIGADKKVLRTKALPVEKFDDTLKKLIVEMKAVMFKPTKDGVVGIGIAAPQVGVLKRVMIVTFNMNDPKKQTIKIMVNPEIIEESKKTVVMEEGCLSLPGEFGDIRRASKIKVQWKNENGVLIEKKLDGWDARIFLHEYDHLEGVLFIDYLAKNKK